MQFSRFPRNSLKLNIYILASCIVVFLSVQIVAVIHEPFCAFNAKGMCLFIQAPFVEQPGTNDKFLRQSRFQCFATEKYLLQDKRLRCCRPRRQRYRSSSSLTRHGGFCWSTFVCAITLLNVFCGLSSLASRHRKRFSSFYSYFVELVVLNYEIRFKN